MLYANVRRLVAPGLDCELDYRTKLVSVPFIMYQYLSSKPKASDRLGIRLRLGFHWGCSKDRGFEKVLAAIALENVFVQITNLWTILGSGLITSGVTLPRAGRMVGGTVGGCSGWDLHDCELPLDGVPSSDCEDGVDGDGDARLPTSEGARVR